MVKQQNSSAPQPRFAFYAYDDWHSPFLRDVASGPCGGGASTICSYHCQVLFGNSFIEHDLSQKLELEAVAVVAIANRVSSVKSNRRIAEKCMTCMFN